MAFIVGGVIMGAATLGAAYMSSQAQKKMQRANDRLTREQLAYQQEQQEKLDAQKEVYKSFNFTNPYAGMQNQFAENVFEDLTVNQQQAQFQAQQGAQQRADILGQLREAAGGSGISGLAQQLANQQQLQTQQISASIGQQEAQNQRLRAQGALQVQKGAAAADMAIRGGEAMLQQAESSRQATLLGVEYAGAAGANAAVQQAYANQMQGNAMAAQMQQDRINMMMGTLNTMSEQGMFDQS